MFSFHHVSLSVKDLKRSIAFYSTFGFKQVFLLETENNGTSMAHLKLGNFLLELFQHQDHKPSSQSPSNYEYDLQFLGIKHFALRVPSIETAKNKVIEQNLSDHVDIRKGRSGVDYFFIRDPDGCFIEIVQDDREIL